MNFNFFGNKKNERALQTTVVSDRNSYFKQIADRITGKVNGEFNFKSAENASIIYTCISILANNTSRLPINIWSDDGNRKTKFFKHEFYNALRYKPQSYYSSDNWLKIIITHLYLTGNAFAYINHKNKSLDILHPDLVDEIRIKDGNMWYYSKELIKVFRHDEILHFKLISKDGAWGLSPINSLRTELNLNHKSTKTLDSYYSNNVHSSKYIQQQAGLTTTNPKIAELIDKFREDYAGVNNSGELIVVPPLFEMKEMKISVSDLDFLTTSNYSRVAIASLYGIPEYMVSEQQYAGNFENQALNFKNNTLASVLNILRAEFENKLLTIDERNGGVTIEFDLNSLVETDLTTKANAAKILNSMGVLSPNEIRKSFNYDVVDSPNMNFHYQQMQLVPVETNDFSYALKNSTDVLKAEQDNNTKKESI